MSLQGHWILSALVRCVVGRPGRFLRPWFFVTQVRRRSDWLNRAIQYLVCKYLNLIHSKTLAVERGSSQNINLPPKNHVRSLFPPFNRQTTCVKGPEETPLPVERNTLWHAEPDLFRSSVLIRGSIWEESTMAINFRLSNIPPITKATLLASFLLSLLCAAFRYRLYASQTITLREVITEQQLALPFLTLIPAASYLFPWTLITASFVQQNIISVLPNDFSLLIV
jgi:hypothetical protein